MSARARITREAARLGARHPRWITRATTRVALLTLVVAGMSMPAAARTDSDGIGVFLPHLPQAASGPATAALATAGRLRVAGAAGQLAPALLQLMQETDGAPQRSALPAPGGSAAGELAGLPPAVAGAVAGLDAAVQTAYEMVGPLPAADVVDVANRSLDALGRWSAEHNPPGSRRPLTRPPARAAGPTAPVDPSRPPTLTMPKKVPGSIAHALREAPRAAALLAAAVDAYVPQLRAHAGTTPTAPHAAVAGCDIADLAPRLCVASDAANTHSANYLLTVDLGGNDRYLNSAGGAPFALDAESFSPIAVVVDVAGNDTFASTGFLGKPFHPAPVYQFAPPVLVGSGAGAFGGVGILVDLDGDDTHVATAPVADEGDDVATREASGVIAQGAAMGGIGILVDHAGDDSYSAVAGAQPLTASVSAQGTAIGPCYGSLQESPEGDFVGLACHEGWTGALLVDLLGDDTYDIDAGSADGNGTAPPLRAATGQGSTVFAGAMLLDTGGEDAFRLRAASTGPQNREADGGGRGFSVVGGQALGWLGRSWLLTGAGATTYEASVTTTGLSGWQWIEAQSAALAFGTAVLDDLGGADTYRARSDAATRYTLGGPSCCDDWIDVVGPLQTMRVQAAADLGATAVLADHGGDDRYTATAQDVLDVTMDGARYAGATLGVSKRTDAVAQGAGSVAGIAALLDAAGTDGYVFNATVSSAARGVAHDGVSPDVVALVDVGGFAQGGGYGGDAGVLVDAGGAGDTFVATIEVPQPDVPDPRGAFAVLSSRLQGRSGTFVALGSAPTVLATPSVPTDCAKSAAPRKARGTGSGGAWVDCGYNTLGGGAAPMTASLPPSQLVLDLDRGQRDDSSLSLATPRVTVRATVLDSGGRPAADRRVHFFLAKAAADGATMENLYTSATTNAAGVATAAVPLAGSGHVELDEQPVDHGILAVVDAVAAGANATGAGPAHEYKLIQFD